MSFKRDQSRKNIDISIVAPSHSTEMIANFEREHFPASMSLRLQKNVSENVYLNDSSSQVAKINTPIHKLVDYDLSTSSESEECNQNSKTASRILFKRIDSDVSFSTGTEVELDSENENCDSNEQKVGKSGYRKKSKTFRKLEKKLQKNFGIDKKVRSNPCSKNCQNNCLKIFSESVRHDIHDFYWGLGDRQRQNDWLLSCIKEVGIKRRRQEAHQSRRSTSYKYYVPWEDKEIAVCQQFLLKTLDISQMKLRYTKLNAVNYKCSKSDHRGKRQPANKTSHKLQKIVLDFIEKLPAVPSHYCRNKSSRKYLPVDLRNVSFLYRLYKKEQEDVHGKTNIVSLKVFRDVFKKYFNLGFHLPKKDKCKLCEIRKDPGFKETTESEKICNDHLALKEGSKFTFLLDQKKHIETSNVLCASFDLQKVLNTPHGDNILLYYSRKYSYYNETVYESGLQNGFCFLWGECDGNRGSNEICSIMNQYLLEVDSRGTITHVILYCDSCAGQNRNRAMLTMLYNFLKVTQNIKTIKIVYLLPGHTYMQVDSIHAVIERAIKRRIIWAPSDWENVIEYARIHPKPFNVHVLKYSDFYNWKQLGDDTIRNSMKIRKKFKLQISKIKIAVFGKGQSSILINYNYNDNEFQKFEVESKISGPLQPKSLYNARLPISVQKKKDLMNLVDKNIIPSKYHKQYRNMKSAVTIRDELEETDEEDSFLDS